MLRRLAREPYVGNDYRQFRQSETVHCSGACGREAATIGGQKWLQRGAHKRYVRRVRAGVRGRVSA